jgi:hypothetical protein
MFIYLIKRVVKGKNRTVGTHVPDGRNRSALSRFSDCAVCVAAYAIESVKTPVVLSYVRYYTFRMPDCMHSSCKYYPLADSKTTQWFASEFEA